MPQKRFSFLSCFIEYNEYESQAERFLLCHSPSEHLATDETLYPYKGRIGFKQYNSKKPTKYSLLYHSLCDSTVQYTYYSLPYAWKPENPNARYVTGIDNYTKYLVENAIRVSGVAGLKGRNIGLDCYFTSLAIADWCLTKGITITGNLQKDRIGIVTERKGQKVNHVVL